MRLSRNIHQPIGLFLVLSSWALIALLGQITELARLERETLLWLHILFATVQSFGFFIFCGSLNPALLAGNLIVHFFLPLLGPFFVVVYVVTVALSRKMDLLSDFHEEDKALALNRTQHQVRTYGESIRGTVNVEPLVETLRSHSGADLKRGAIETLTQISSPQSVALLKECLTDPNSEVRFYASSGLSRIEENLNQNILRHKRQLEQSVKPSFGDHLGLGKAYYEFVFLNMQDADSLGYYVRQAISHFEKALALNPEEPAVIQALEKAYYRTCNHDALSALRSRQGLEKSPQDPMYLAEYHFNSGNLAAAGQVLGQMKDQKLYQAVRDVRELWLLRQPPAGEHGAKAEA